MNVENASIDAMYVSPVSHFNTISFISNVTQYQQTNPCDQNIILTSCNNQNDNTNRYKATMIFFFLLPFFHLSIFFALMFFLSKNPIMFFGDKTLNTKKNNNEQFLETPN